MEDGKKKDDLTGKAKFFVLLLLIAGMIALSYVSQKSGGGAVGTPAPSFRLPSRAGSVALDQFRGRVVLINFWATWCPPCLQEMPSLESLKRQMEGREFQILAINLDEEGWPAVDQFLQRMPLTMTILVDSKNDIAGLYGTNYLPESFLIDRKGIIVKTYTGPRDWTEAGLVSEILKYVDNP